MPYTNLIERITALEVQIKALYHEFDLRDKSVISARENIDYRLNQMNHLREQISSERNTFLTRKEYDLKHELLVEQVGRLARRRAEDTGETRGWHASTTQMIAIFVAVTTCAALLVGVAQQLSIT